MKYTPSKLLRNLAELGLKRGPRDVVTTKSRILLKMVPDTPRSSGWMRWKAESTLLRFKKIKAESTLLRFSTVLNSSYQYYY